MTTSFRFEHPWLLLLLLVPALFWIFGDRWKNPPVIRFSGARIFADGKSFRYSWTKTFQNSLYYFGCAFLILALARPQFGIASSRSRANGIDIMLLLDVSLSMLSEDFSIGSQRASRLDVVGLFLRIRAGQFHWFWGIVGWCRALSHLQRCRAVPGQDRAHHDLYRYRLRHWRCRDNRPRARVSGP